MKGSSMMQNRLHEDTPFCSSLPKFACELCYCKWTPYLVMQSAYDLPMKGAQPVRVDAVAE